MTLELTEAALGDLRKIREYTFSQWGEAQEQTYLDGIWDKFEELIADPERWRSREDLFPGCRMAIHHKHLILFRVDGAKLQVIRVLHGAMDLKRRLDD
ncbi:MAG: type II toxin-antitoxin system RelE/ParE family toxin [Verrucomicrobiaceae bacterium]|nr:type II toxin-antitoxin system RelE/ParE family toxin [Verrucomicrobiaceae bacterium]